MGHRRAIRSLFRPCREAAATGLFDIMSHLDLIKKFGYRTSRT